MTPKFTLSSWLMYLSSAIIISGCCGGFLKKDEKKSYHLVDQHSKILPYQDKQVVRFRDSNNQEFDAAIQQSERSGEIPNCFEDCCSTRVFADVLITEFTSSMHQELLPVLIVSPQKTPSDRNGSLQFYLWANLPSGDVVVIERDAKLVIDDNYKLRCVEEPCQSSIEISNQVFENVFEITHTVFNGSSSNSHDYIYHYSEELGLLKVEHEEYQTSNGTKVSVSTETLVRVF